MGKAMVFVGLLGAAAAFVFVGPRLASGKTAPDFTLPCPGRGEFTLSEQKGNIVVLDFFASWCPPCRMAIPEMQKLHEEYAGRGVVVLGVNAWERHRAPSAFMREMRATYPIVLNGDEVAKEYGVEGIPTFVVVGPDGKILLRESGWSSRHGREIREVIDKALAR